MIHEQALEDRTRIAQLQDELGDYYDAGMIGKPPKLEDFPETDTPPPK